ncbi:hypothetical protein BDR04DRAFT_968656, partial [Suillus decipiens]
WMSDDETRLINYITTHKAKGGDGLNFDKNFWAQVTQNMASSTTVGLVKTADACHQKWVQVSTFHVVDRVAHYSGISWSTECGTNIMAKSETVWTDIIK